LREILKVLRNPERQSVVLQNLAPDSERLQNVTFCILLIGRSFDFMVTRPLLCVRKRFLDTPYKGSPVVCRKHLRTRGDFVGVRKVLCVCSLRGHCQLCLFLEEQFGKADIRHVAGYCLHFPALCFSNLLTPTQSCVSLTCAPLPLSILRKAALSS
jgi:hypothetical protein